MRCLRKAEAIFDRLLDVQVYGAGAIVIGSMLLICIDVVLRYFFNRPIGGTEEVCGIGLLFIVSLGMAWLLKKEGHVKMDIVLIRLRPRPQALVNAITSASCAMTLLVITWYGLQKTLRLVEAGVVRFGGIWDISIAIVLIPLAIGCFLFSIQFVRRSYMYLRSWRQAKL